MDLFGDHSFDLRSGSSLDAFREAFEDGGEVRGDQNEACADG